MKLLLLCSSLFALLSACGPDWEPVDVSPPACLPGSICPVYPPYPDSGARDAGVLCQRIEGC